MLYFDQEPRAGLPPSKSECPWPVDFVADTLQGEIIKQALSAAQGAKDAADDASKKAEAASASVEQAKTAAQSAQTGAESANTSAQSAKTAAETAQEKAEAASASVQSAKTAAETAQVKAEAASASAQSAKAAAETARDEAEAASTSAQSAKAAAETARDEAEAANTSAQSAKTAAETARDEAEAASTSAQSAKAAAETARDEAEAASTSAQSAKTTAETARDEAEAASTSAQSAKTAALDSSKLSKSWAVGGTGVREGESLNNAMYWASVAEAASAGGVLTFNGRSGAVAPQKGDYTAAMVGADEQGAAQTVQDNLNTHAQNTTAHISATERTSWNAKANAADLTSHVDDAVKHISATERTAWNSKVGKSTKVNLTLYASSWSTEKKYTVSNANITATSAVELLPRENNGITQAQMEALSGAMIVGGAQAAESIQLIALGDKPTTDIPVTLIIRRDL